MSFLNQGAGIPTKVVQSTSQLQPQSPFDAVNVAPSEHNAQQSGDAQNNAFGGSADGESIVVTRRFNVHIFGTLADFSRQGPNAARWSPNDNTHAAFFGITPDSQARGSIGAQEHTDMLKNAKILRITKLAEKNNFPMALGVCMNCGVPNEMNEKGQAFLFTTIPNSYNSEREVLYECSGENANAKKWRQMFPSFHANNLGDKIMTQKGDNFGFVHISHPIIHLLRNNKALLGTDIDKHPLIDGKYLKVSLDTINTCLGAISDHLKQNVNEVRCDLHAMEAQLFRLDAGDWLEEHCSEPESDMCGRHDTHRYFMGRFELQYELTKRGG